LATRPSAGSREFAFAQVTPSCESFLPQRLSSPIMFSPHRGECRPRPCAGEAEGTSRGGYVPLRFAPLRSATTSPTLGRKEVAAKSVRCFPPHFWGRACPALDAGWPEGPEGNFRSVHHSRLERDIANLRIAGTQMIPEFLVLVWCRRCSSRRRDGISPVSLFRISFRRCFLPDLWSSRSRPHAAAALGWHVLAAGVGLAIGFTLFALGIVGAAMRSSSLRRALVRVSRPARLCADRSSSGGTHAVMLGSVSAASGLARHLAHAAARPEIGIPTALSLASGAFAVLPYTDVSGL